MPLSDEEFDAIVSGITDAVLGRVRREFSIILPRLKALEDRPAGVQYCGVWQATATYEKNEAVTWDGSMWVSKTKNTAMKPGASPGAWQLAVKRGADAK